MSRDEGDKWKCSCDAQAWYSTKVTVFEWLAFKIGIFKSPSCSELSMVDAQLGGRPELLKKEENKLQEARQI